MTSAAAVTPSSGDAVPKSISIMSATTSEDIAPVTEKTTADIAAEKDPEFAAALERQRQRKYEEEKIMCSLENKEACLMCSS